MKGKSYTSPIQYSDLEPPAPEVHLRQMHVVEALEKLRLYLQDAHVAGMNRVRVIHGKGTGVLKAAVLEALADSPLVAHYYMADPHEGGGGVTIVEMALEED